jgi:hypothetical protein
VPVAVTSDEAFIRWLLSARVFDYSPSVKVEEDCKMLEKDEEEEEDDVVAADRVFRIDRNASPAQQLEVMRHELVTELGKGVAIACVCAMRAAFRRDSDGREAEPLVKARMFATALRPLDRIEFTSPRGLALLRSAACIALLLSLGSSNARCLIPLTSQLQTQFPVAFAREIAVS